MPEHRRHPQFINEVSRTTVGCLIQAIQAAVILNEVTSTRASALNGMMQVHGMRPPSFSSCDRFAALSNTPRTTMSTGGASLAPRRPRQQILLTIGTCTITPGGREPMTIIVAPAAI